MSGPRLLPFYERNAAIMAKEKRNIRKWIAIFASFLLIILVIILGVFAFQDRKYSLVSILVAILACVPFFRL